MTLVLIEPLHSTVELLYNETQESGGQENFVVEANSLMRMQTRSQSSKFFPLCKPTQRAALKFSLLRKKNELGRKWRLFAVH